MWGGRNGRTGAGMKASATPKDVVSDRKARRRWRQEKEVEQPQHSCEARPRLLLEVDSLSKKCSPGKRHGFQRRRCVSCPGQVVLRARWPAREAVVRIAAEEEEEEEEHVKSRSRQITGGVEREAVQALAGSVDGRQWSQRDRHVSVRARRGRRRRRAARREAKEAAGVVDAKGGPAPRLGIGSWRG
ncbi:uncharacterized protein B0I36DRAFT_37270 [Microdochium trichocladiopsis]|uniref:Uncharacterized protein n=1 Tax=Microdochium trichocladiopsis TaxID=1682393 RepID=A0A9P9BHA0_9PEZI|nr:uncharacterized protein B0I36DRAFT_37270 [Microdochium trichocladiopsis]KAH7018269.1 hypothetical protein B0I36DRAFT_37270 [Microdochium trichocladiopsis]